ncbi:MAG: energy-coupling factor ABC transporter permease [Planctomycetes bacterium]|nr:energy-coupling factor ABC transporter permease [Planctomycetota bacterium]
MHIPDGPIIAPKIHIATAVITAIACAIAVKMSSKSLDEKKVPLIGVTSSFVFAAQMLNFPIGLGTSGHFLGAVLTSVLLGPWNAFIVIAVVLTTQCFILADGGFTALGSNIFNMGVIGGLASYGIFRLLTLFFPKTKAGFLAAVGIVSWFSVVLASAACAAEIGVTRLSELYDIKYVLPAMAGVHAIIGIGEAVITVTVVSMIMAYRKDVIYNYELRIKN